MSGSRAGSRDRLESSLWTDNEDKNKKGKERGFMPLRRKKFCF